MKGALKYAKDALLFSLLIGVGFAFTGYPANAAEPKAKTAAPEPKKKGETTKIDPTDPESVIYLDTSGKPAGVGDPNKPAGTAYKAGRGWHPQALTAAGLPKDRYGLIDWAKLVRSNLVKPRPSLSPDEEEMPPLQMDVLILAKGDFVDDVIYPHEMHTYWLKCEICHASKGGAIFIPARGQNNMTMVAIAQGEFCGRCHGKVAFPLSDCKRCHTSPKSSHK
ncbi:MAG: hypothetical protein HZB83_09215 [Deltaproteobacteria bacterium]|nr:hypothetical protein [Deltaproteobacteria bacterium]